MHELTFIESRILKSNEHCNSFIFILIIIGIKILLLLLLLLMYVIKNLVPVLGFDRFSPFFFFFLLILKLNNFYLTPNRYGSYHF